MFLGVLLSRDVVKVELRNMSLYQPILLTMSSDKFTLSIPQQLSLLMWYFPPSNTFEGMRHVGVIVRIHYCIVRTRRSKHGHISAVRPVGRCSCKLGKLEQAVFVVLSTLEYLYLEIIKIRLKSSIRISTNTKQGAIRRVVFDRPVNRKYCA